MNTYIDFPTAKLLKEKGFGMSDEDYIQLPRFYEQDGNYIGYDVHVGKKYNPYPTHLGADNIDDFEAHLTMIDNSLDDIYLAPTIAEVVMWLYEKHGIWVFVKLGYGHEYVIQSTKSPFTFIYSDGTFNSPTEAYQAAIKYCLTKLI